MPSRFIFAMSCAPSVGTRRWRNSVSLSCTSKRHAQSSVLILVNYPTLDHDTNVRQCRDVEQWIAIDDNDVCEFPGFDRAEVARLSDDLCVHPRRGCNCTCRSHSHIDMDF